MEAYQERVIAEKEELDSKLSKLKDFCFGDDTTIFNKLTPVDRDLLESQFTAMEEYSRILGKRISRFNKE